MFWREICSESLAFAANPEGRLLGQCESNTYLFSIVLPG